MKKNTVCLYNVLFPLWFFFFYPTPLWLLILAGNFIIDFAVVYFGGKKLKAEDPKELCRQSIFKVWMIGFLSDFLGAGLIFLMFIGVSWLDQFVRVPIDIGRGFWCILFSLPGLLFSGWLIYRLNKRFSFNGTELNRAQIRRLCFWLAVLTAPYLMVLPTYW
ncbi:MAG: hypothetical protein Q4F09_05655 [Erysipelotrichaceae bacterium]|nr:hypothetical protein [Erysipelotrichaceae bacterium]